MVPFLITFLAGCSTLIGYLFVYFKNHSNKVLISSLAFASGVMLLISIYYLIPSFLICSVFVVGGILLSMTIDKYLPDNSYQDSYLYRVGMISMIAIILHNIPEGIATYLTTNHDLRLGITLAFALALHNIPEGISIAVPIYYSTKNRKKAFLYTLVSGMSEFLGAIFASIFLTSFSNDFFMGCLYAIIAGIMIHISVYELLPSSLKYHKYSTTFLFFFLGIIVMFISCLLLH